MKIYNPTGFSSSLTGSFSGSVKGTFEGSFTGESLNNISGAFDSVSASLASGKLNNTTDTLDGDLTVTGTITAQEFHTEFVSASIIYESGSTQFGNSADDTHIFTGNIGIGTSSPTSLVHIRNTSYGTALAQFETSGRPLTLGAQSSYVYMGYGNREQFKIAASAGDGRFILGSSLSDDGNNTLQVNGTSYFAGSVGIGTTSPGTKLHLESGVSDGIIVRTSANVEPFMTLQRNAGSNGVAVLRGMDGGDLKIDTGATGAAQSTKVTIGAGGNVKIGSGTAGHKLEVSGSINIEGSSYSYKINDINVLGVSATYTQLYNPEGATGVYVGDSADRSNYYDNNYHYFRVAGGTSTLGVWNTSGLGIGTSTPGSSLDVVSNAGGNGVSIRTRSNNDWGWLIYNSYDNSERLGEIGINRTAANTGDIYFTTANGGSSTTRMVLKSDGKLGINTTSPGERLDVVSGNIRSYAATNNYGQIQHGSFLAVGDHGGTFMLDLDNNGSADLVNIKKSGSSRFYINNDGNVGIGNTSPQHKLHIGSSYEDTIVLADGRTSGDTNTRFDSSIVWDAYYQQSARIAFEHNDVNVTYRKLKFQISSTTPGNYNDGIVLQQNGHVGIGTNSPNKQLTVYGGNDNGFWLDSAGGQYTTIALGNNGSEKANIFWDNTNTNFGIITYGSSGMSFTANSNQAITIKSDGNVGIGSTSPSQALDVNGVIRAKGLNNHQDIITKEGSTGTFTFTQAELNGGIIDNISYFIFVSVYRPTTDVTNDVASLILHGVMPRGANSTFNTVSTLKGSGISTLTATNSGNSLVITTDSGTNFKCSIKVIAIGGTS